MSCPVDHAAQRLSPTGCPISGNAAAFDPFSLAYQRDPAGTLAWAREQEPVFYSPELGYWVVTRYDDVKAVFRDNILFSPSIALEKITPAPPEAAAILQRYGYAMNRTMVNEDEPDHMERRRLLMDAFLPEALARHEPAVRALARQYMDRFHRQGPCRPGGGDVLRDPADHRAALPGRAGRRRGAVAPVRRGPHAQHLGPAHARGAAQGGRERRPLLAGGAEDPRRHDGQAGWRGLDVRDHPPAPPAPGHRHRELPALHDDGHHGGRARDHVERHRQRLHDAADAPRGLGGHLREPGADPQRGRGMPARGRLHHCLAAHRHRRHQQWAAWRSRRVASC
jgi:hypothetical protein